MIVTHPISRWLFHRFHPNFGIGLAHWLSQNGGDHNYENVLDHEVKHRGEEDYLYQYVRRKISLHPEIICYIFGHRHVLIQDDLEAGNVIGILGDWIQYFSFLEIGPEGHALKVCPAPHRALYNPSQDLVK